MNFGGVLMSEKLHRRKLFFAAVLLSLVGMFVTGRGITVYDCIAQDVESPQSALDTGGEPKAAPELRALDALSQFKAQQAGRVANVSIEVPIDVVGFPAVKAFVLVTDPQGKAVEELLPTAFTVREQRIGEAIREPQNLKVRELSLEVTKADIVFVVDQSGSMEDEIATVRDGIQRFAELLSKSNINFRLGGVSYEGEGRGGIGFGKSTGGFIGDYKNGITTGAEIEEFRRWARSIPASGGTERGYDAIVTVTQPPFIYRPDAQQIICLVTDEGNDPGANNVTDAFNAIGKRKLFFFNTAVKSDMLQETDRDYEQLGTRLGGAFNEQTLLNQLGAMITRKYVIEYTSPWPEKDCIQRELTVIVTDPQNQQLIKQDTKPYTPGNQGVISGTISDQATGGLLQGVSVTLLQGENIVNQVLTDEQSEYSLEELCKGNYVIRAAKVGYKTEEKKVVLEVNGKLTVDFELTLSDSKDEKEVLIAQLKKIKQYAEEEQLAQQYLDSLEFSSPSEMEPLRRLILAENLVNEAYINAEQRADIAGLAVGTTLVFLVDDILLTKAIKKVVDKLIPEKTTFRFFGEEIEQTNIFISVKENIFGMLDTTIIEVTNRIVIYTIQVFPDTASALKNEVAKIITEAITGLIMEELSVEEIVGNLIKQPLLILYGDFTDEAIEQSVNAAETKMFTGPYQKAEHNVASYLIIIIQDTDEIRQNVEDELANAETAKTVQSIAGSVAKISAVFSASGVMGVVAAIAKIIEIGSIAVKYGYSGYAAGTSTYSLLVDLPQQVNLGTAAAFGRSAWPAAPQIPISKSPLFVSTPLDNELIIQMPINPSAPKAMAQAQANFGNQLDRLIEFIDADQLADALEFTNDNLLPASEAFRKTRNASENRVLAVGGNAFKSIPLFELRYKKLATLSPDTSLQTVAFFTKLLAFFWQASNASSPQDEDYQQSKADIIIEARALRDKVQTLTEELDAAITLTQGFRIAPTVIVDDFEVTSDGNPTTTISESPQNFTVTATLKNLGSYGVNDITAKLILPEGSTLSVTTEESVSLKYLQGGQSAEVKWELRHVGPTKDVRNAVILDVEPINPERPNFNTFPPTVLMIASAPKPLSPPTGNKLSNQNIYAYPNPFNPLSQQVTIRYSLEADSNITIKIYDVQGVLVKTLIDNLPREKNTEHAEIWDGRNEQGDIVSNGVYFYLIETNKGKTAAGKIAVLQ